MRALNTATRNEMSIAKQGNIAGAWIRLHGADLDTAAVSWHTPDGRDDKGSLGDAAAACQGALVDVIVPGECVLLTSATMPKAGARQLRQAFPFAVEEFLAEDVEQLHVALAPSPRGRGADDPVYGAVVSHAMMRHWTEALRTAGLRIRHLVPDTLCLPLPTKLDDGDSESGAPWILWIEDDRFILRTGVYTGLAGECALLTSVIKGANASADGQVCRIRLCNDRSTQIPQLVGIDGVRFENDDGLCEEGSPLAVERAAGLDLLQEPYRPDTARRGGPRAWLWPAVMVWVLVGANLAAVSIEHVHLSARYAALQHDITALYRSTFPQDRRIVDARVQMEQHLKALQTTGGGGDRFVKLLASLGNAVRAAPVLTVNAVSYRNQRLNVRLTAPSVAMVESLRDRLEQSGHVHAHIESIDAGQDRQGGNGGRTQVSMSIEENKP